MLLGGSTTVVFLGTCFYLLVQIIHTEAGISDEDGLGQKFLKLYEHYETNIKSIKSDCRPKDNSDDDGKHHHWGTFTSLKYLTEQYWDATTYGEQEKYTNLKKLRKFLARVGFLKNPGSLILLDKQTQTLRLHGCPADSTWRQQGEYNEDKIFQESHHTGETLKVMSPNAYNYIHKITCFHLEKKCSHTFYVITRPQPEVPLGLQVAEGKHSDEIDFTCTYPFCRMEDCDMGSGELYNRRTYPPYEIKWDIPKSLREKLDLNGEPFVTISMGNNLTSKFVEFKFFNKTRKSKDLPYNSKDSYKKIDFNADKDKQKYYKDGFGDVFDGDVGNYSFHSRIKVKSAKTEIHSGRYECIIIDNNGIPTTPSSMFEEYRGQANINVMPFWQKWVPAVVTVSCVILVALLILICPKKMEYDDGTPYTKDELISPAEMSTAK